MNQQRTERIELSDRSGWRSLGLDWRWVGWGWVVLLILGAASGCASKTGEREVELGPVTPKRPVYPYAPTNDIVEVFHGVEIADPYRWLEDPESAAAVAWATAQNELTSDWLRRITERSRIRARVAELGDYERRSLPVLSGGRRFYTRTLGGAGPESVWWSEVGQSSPRLLLDVRATSGDGSSLLVGFVPSQDGEWLAYGSREVGLAGQTWRVRRVTTGVDEVDRVPHVRFSSVAWAGDHTGFYYTRWVEVEEEAASPAGRSRQAICFHRLGTSAVEDEVIFERPDRPDWNLFSEVTTDGRYLVITVTEGTRAGNGIWHRDLEHGASEVVASLSEFDANYRFIGNDGERFYFQTDAGAPLGRVIALTTSVSGEFPWEEVVAEKEVLLEAATYVDGRFYLRYLESVVSRVTVWEPGAESSWDVPLPGRGSVTGFGEAGEEGEVYFAYSDFATPTTLLRYDPEQNSSVVSYAPEIGFDPNEYETRQVAYRSRDGMRVPMFLTSRKGLERQGDAPTLLYVYGGFGVSMKPAFSPAQLAWMELGGVYAVPNVRGGGEFGEPWHQAGMRAGKQNSIDDTLAAAEWLIANHVTSPRRLAIMGGSNGGLVAAACVTQRPGLFSAGLLSTPVLDMMRFAKFTIGWAWIPEYGDVEDPGDFAVLHAYSPLHRLVAGRIYPSMFVTTGAGDRNVVSAHSYKFMAALQASHAGDNPVLVRIQTPTGFPAAASTDRLVEETVDRWTFLVRELRMEVR